MVVPLHILLWPLSWADCNVYDKKKVSEKYVCKCASLQTIKFSLRISFITAQGEENKSQMGERKLYNYEDTKVILKLIQI
jgi:hypothetical protein